MKKLLIIIITSIVLGNASAVLAASGDAGDAAAFLKIGQSVRALGMGKAFIAIADDATASYWNPAGLAQLKKREIMIMYNKPFSVISGIQQENIAIAWPVSQENITNVLGVNVFYSSVKGIKGYDESGLPTGNDIGNRDMAYLLSWGIGGLFPDTDFGLTFKTISQKIYTYSDYGFGADIGSLYHWQNFRFGIVLQDVVRAKIKLKDVSDTVPRKLRAGVSYTLPNKLTVSMGIDSIQRRDLKEHFGIEYTIAELVSLRSGYTTDSNEITAGLGFQKEYWQIDYAYARHQQLENTHRFSLSIRF